MEQICSNGQEENSVQAKYCFICSYKLQDLETSNVKSEYRAIKGANTKKRINIKSMIGIIVGAVLGVLITQALLKPSIDK